MKRLLFLVLILVSCGLYAQSVGPFSPQEIGGISSILSPIKFGGKKLPSWLQDSNAVAPIFNGVNQYALNSDTSAFKIGGTDSFTVMSWVKLSSPINSTDRRALIGKGDSNSTTGGLFNIFFRSTASYNGLTLRMIASSGTAIADIIPSTDQTSKFADFSYHHVAIGRSGASGYFIYVDGASVGAQKGGSADITAAVASNASALFIGGLGHFGSIVAASQFPGNIAELSIWNRALSQDEILRYKDKRLRGTETGLVALYHMNDNAQTLVDSVSGKNAVASNSVAWGRRNPYPSGDIRAERYALSFDGVDDLASATNASISAYPITTESWVFTPSVTAGNRVGFVGVGSLSANANYLGSYLSAALTNRFEVVIERVNEGTSTAKTASTTVALGSWAHIATVFESAASSAVFVNGALAAVDTTSVNLVAPNAIRIGVTPKAASLVYSKGKHAEVRIWNTARTQAEIQANLYTQMTGSETGLVYYYRGNEGTGTTLTNLGSAGAAGNLTLYNSPTWVGRDIP